ncbi:MAG: hypothetical protein ACLQJ7_13820 [Syntrophobacteraceae bacterium]
MKDAGAGPPARACQDLIRGTRSGDIDAKLRRPLGYNLIRSIYSIECSAAGVFDVINPTAGVRQVYCNRMVFR